MEWWFKNRVVARARDLFRRHWQRALRWREKFVFKEEAFHLVLAGIVGVIGGLVNLFFFYVVHFIQPGDPVEFAENLPDWERLLVPTSADWWRAHLVLGVPPGGPSGFK